MDEYMNNEIGVLIKTIQSLSELDEEALKEAIPELKRSIEESYSEELKEQSINQLIKNLEDQRLDREGAANALEAAKMAINDIIKLDELTKVQTEAAKELLDPLYETFDKALARYHLYHIDLPIKLEDDAKVPTYAHDTDAAADLYALEDVTIQGGTKGNKIRTGVSIQLPEGWLAMILPRSSTGAKTPLRLSNSVGLIDSGYRGELGVLYDNTSEVPYEIKAGDRIAQLLVMPSYRFQAKVVESLEDSDRGEGGFGSTGA